MNHPAIARRSLLTAAGCALLRPAAASSGHERLQNKTYAADIIVIGFGAAGASAAIEAARAGSSVLILEKSPQKSHCSSTRMSSGIYLCPDRGISEEVLAQYIASTYLPDGGVSYREGKMDPDLTALARIWAKLGPQTYEWLHSLDPDFRQATSALFTTRGLCAFGRATALTFKGSSRLTADGKVFSTARSAPPNWKPAAGKRSMPV